MTKPVSSAPTPFTLTLRLNAKPAERALVPELEAGLPQPGEVPA